MLCNNIPLTDEERTFAADHHDKTVKDFFRKFHLSKDELYDVVIFGYLKAVRDYLNREDLRKRYKFCTIAFKDMWGCYTNYCAAMKRPCRNAHIQEYIDGIMLSGREPMRSVEESVTAHDEAQRIARHFTAQEDKIIYLRTKGHSLTEIGRKCGLRRQDVQAHLASARNNVVRFDPDLAEAA